MFFHLYDIRTASGSQPTSSPIRRGSHFPGIKGMGLEGDHSFPSSTEFKNARSRTSTLPYSVRVWCLIKHKDDFTITSVIACNET